MSFQSKAMSPFVISTTPTGLQSLQTLAWRRRLFGVFNLALYVVLMSSMARLLAADGWGWLDLGIFICFGLVLPWSVLGFGNAMVGLWLLHIRRDGLANVAPYAQAGDDAKSITLRTAIVMTLRNEDPMRALARLRCVEQSLQATGFGAQFAYFVLSDTSDKKVADVEQTAFQHWNQVGGPGERHYRRRIDNVGFKAGNIRDFCENLGGGFEFMLPLDADSLMSGDTIVRLVAMAQAHPNIGILQSLVVGAPTSSAFARLFQFGMRHGMRPYSIGSAWWSGDCGQFWGHNGLVRIKPFIAFCDLPILPGGPPFGGAILSHDQVEAALMRRAGFEVRVLPVECESYEDNPPNLLEFARRDQRWAAGNMQYGPLIFWRGLLATSRFQLIWAMAMFISLPAMNVLLVLVALRALSARPFPVAEQWPALALYGVFFVLQMVPKLAGFIDTALTRGGVARYGGARRFLISSLCELLFSFLVSGIVGFLTSLFLVRLPLGGKTIWSGQVRDAHALPFADVVRALWLPTLFGSLLLAAFTLASPSLGLWSLFYTIGLILAVPLTIASAHPAVGQWLQSRAVCALPEEINPPPILQALEALSLQTLSLQTLSLQTLSLQASSLQTLSLEERT